MATSKNVAKVVMCSLLISSSLGLVGCGKKKKKNTIIGTVVGGAAGAGIGAIAGGGAGAAIGGISGAVTGGVLGNVLTKEEK